MFRIAIALLIALGTAPTIAWLANEWLGIAITMQEVIAGFGILIAALGAWLVFAGVSSRSWGKIRGSITESSITGSGGSSSRTAHWDPKVTYCYTVDGCEFTGSRIAFGQPSYGKWLKAYKVITRYPVGSQTDVYAYPSNPSVCVLEPGVQMMPLFYLIAGLLLSLAYFADLPPP